MHGCHITSVKHESPHKVPNYTAWWQRHNWCCRNWQNFLQQRLQYLDCSFSVQLQPSITVGCWWWHLCICQSNHINVLYIIHANSLHWSQIITDDWSPRHQGQGQSQWSLRPRPRFFDLKLSSESRTILEDLIPGLCTRKNTSNIIKYYKF